MKHLSVICFSIALGIPLFNQWRTITISSVIFFILLGSYFIRKYQKIKLREERERASSGDVDWNRYNKQDNTGKFLNQVEPFFKYGVPLVIIISFFIGLGTRAIILTLMYILYLWQNQSLGKT